ncbi:hypothetical protein [Actinophytocola sp.]|uniref:hypothetical protein n=1 Tax=Actinophytocola sp. TaxID=1872138 RepID=UPI002D753CA3|nr:hypothetical protein [Actinophytocola sp.]HYQ67505.1 hypothetical protein [Actinophytocola sp.]
MNTELEDSLADALRAKANAVAPSRMPRLGRAAPARGRLVPLVAAAVAAVAIGGAAIVLAPGDAAPAVKVATPGALAPGEVYYSLRLTSQANGQAIMEKQLWQPRQRTGEWRQRMATGRTIENGRVVPAGAVTPRPGGKCYPAYKVTDENCTAPGSWLNPTVDFLATAPRDPATIGEQFHAAAVAQLEGDQSGDLAYLVELRMIGELLAGNGVPPELSGALRQVVAAMPGIAVTEGMANLTGAQGTGYSLPKPKGNPQTVIFKADNTYLGSPTESIRHGIAPGLGQPPSRMLD